MRSFSKGCISDPRASYISYNFTPKARAGVTSRSARRGGPSSPSLDQRHPGTQNSSPMTWAQGGDSLPFGLLEDALEVVKKAWLVFNGRPSGDVHVLPCLGPRGSPRHVKGRALGYRRSRCRSRGGAWIFVPEGCSGRGELDSRAHVTREEDGASFTGRTHPRGASWRGRAKTRSLTRSEDDRRVAVEGVEVAQGSSGVRVAPGVVEDGSRSVFGLGGDDVRCQVF